MNFQITGLLSIILAFLVSVLSGIFISKRSKPYNTLLLTIHKICSMLAEILISIKIFNNMESSGFQYIQVISFIAAIIIFIVPIITGSLLTIEKYNSTKMIISHKLSSIIAVIYAVIISI